MLKKLVNEACFSLTLTTTGPLLIRSGTPTISAGRNPDMTPVLTYRNGERQVYIPGTSLKGVFRSHLEKIGRTVVTVKTRGICDPFNDNSFCGDKLQKVKDREYKDKAFPTDLAYRQSCPICRLFGSTAYTGRISIDDAYLPENQISPRPEPRDGVGIDRFTGGAADKKLFNLEAVPSGVNFETQVYLRNFE